jgi:hypothetical protein
MKIPFCLSKCWRRAAPPNLKQKQELNVTSTFLHGFYFPITIMWLETCIIGLAKGWVGVRSEMSCRDALSQTDTDPLPIFLICRPVCNFSPFRKLFFKLYKWGIDYPVHTVGLICIKRGCMLFTLLCATIVLNQFNWFIKLV